MRNSPSNRKSSIALKAPWVSDLRGFSIFVQVIIKHSLDRVFTNVLCRLLTSNLAKDDDAYGTNRSRSLS